MGRGGDAARPAAAKGELDAIARLLANDVSGRNGDDAAIVDAPGGRVCVTTDVAIAGRHLHHLLTPWQMGYRAAACALSDLAAMGAVSRGVVCGLSVPDGSWNDVEAISAGVAARAAECGTQLIGGDLVGVDADAPLSIAITCIGSPALAPAPGFSLRSGARSGDLLAVTGTLGGGWTGLRALKHAADTSSDQRHATRANRYLTPPHRERTGRVLAPIVGAMIDISDGIASDVRHIAAASGCGATIDLALLPLAPDLADQPADRERAATWGDDYELLVAIAPERLDAALAAVGSVDPQLGLTVIGRCADAGFNWTNGDRAIRDLTGFQHGVQ